MRRRRQDRHIAPHTMLAVIRNDRNNPLPMLLSGARLDYGTPRDKAKREKIPHIGLQAD